jgi:hypothetical protein
MAIVNEGAIDPMIDFLNELTSLDPEFVRQLISTRFPCNEAIANHPSVQCGEFDGAMKAGILGVLNGFFGTFEAGRLKGWGPIAVLVDGADGPIIKFQRTTEELNAQD